MEPTITTEIDVKLIRHLARDLYVFTAAKVSTAGDEIAEMEIQQLIDDGDIVGLINYLMKNRHGTPFEHNQMTFFMDAPIFVYRELHRHRIGISINEESGRYKELRPKFYVPGPDRNLTQTGKPGHYIFSPGTQEQHFGLVQRLSHAYSIAYEMYQENLADGIAKEVARMCLPVATYSSQYYTVNARSLMAILSLRQQHTTEEARFPSNPMKEINIVADKMEAVFAELMPITHAAFVKNGYVSP